MRAYPTNQIFGVHALEVTFFLLGVGMSDSQTKWCMVSLWALQNSHISLCSVLNFETDLLVVRMLWSILNWSHNSLVSAVVYFRSGKLLFHSISVIPMMFCQFDWTVLLVLSSFTEFQRANQTMARNHKKCACLPA